MLDYEDVGRNKDNTRSCLLDAFILLIKLGTYVKACTSPVTAWFGFEKFVKSFKAQGYYLEHNATPPASMVKDYTANNLVFGFTVLTAIADFLVTFVRQKQSADELLMGYAKGQKFPTILEPGEKLQDTFHTRAIVSLRIGRPRSICCKKLLQFILQGIFWLSFFAALASTAITAFYSIPFLVRDRSITTYDTHESGLQTAGSLIALFNLSAWIPLNLGTFLVAYPQKAQSYANAVFPYLSESWQQCKTGIHVLDALIQGIFSFVTFLIQRIYPPFASPEEDIQPAKPWKDILLDCVIYFFKTTVTALGTTLAVFGSFFYKLKSSDYANMPFLAAFFLSLFNALNNLSTRMVIFENSHPWALIHPYLPDYYKKCRVFVEYNDLKHPIPHRSNTGRWALASVLFAVFWALALFNGATEYFDTANSVYNLLLNLKGIDIKTDTDLDPTSLRRLFIGCHVLALPQGAVTFAFKVIKALEYGALYCILLADTICNFFEWLFGRQTTANAAQITNFIADLNVDQTAAGAAGGANPHPNKSDSSLSYCFAFLHALCCECSHTAPNSAATEMSV